MLLLRPILVWETRLNYLRLELEFVDEIGDPKHDQELDQHCDAEWECTMIVLETTGCMEKRGFLSSM